MIAPFILRRSKSMVLSSLPAKIHEIEYCEMTSVQKEIYDSLSIVSVDDNVFLLFDDEEKVTSTVKKTMENLMMYRKVACHPLLVRNLYTDDKLREMSFKLLNV